ncbi:MAG TPA: CBS domain-containing protein, partial [Puia sp.]|nr:CBS domain-containing protein [Puia sp.]
EADALAIEALDLMRTHDITQLVVTGATGYMGFIHLHDLIREGIIYNNSPDSYRETGGNCIIRQRLYEQT